MGGDLDQNISFWQVKGGVTDLLGRGHEGGNWTRNHCAKASACISFTYNTIFDKEPIKEILTSDWDFHFIWSVKINSEPI